MAATLDQLKTKRALVRSAQTAASQTKFNVQVLDVLEASPLEAVTTTDKTLARMAQEFGLSVRGHDGGASDSVTTFKISIPEA